MVASKVASLKSTSLILRSLTPPNSASTTKPLFARSSMTDLKDSQTSLEVIFSIVNRSPFSKAIKIIFKCELTYVLKDQFGKIIEGSSDKIKKQRDIWTFARKMNDKVPNWYLVKTE
jgi:hypothetical protein